MSKLRIILFLLIAILLAGNGAYLFLRGGQSGSEPDSFAAGAVQQPVQPAPEAAKVIEDSAERVPPVWVSNAEERFFAESALIESRDEPLRTDGTFRRIKVVAPPGSDGLFYRAVETVSLSDDGSETVLSRAVMDADQVMVKLNEGAERAELEKLATDFDGRVRERKLGPNVYLVHLAGHGLDTVPDALDYLNSANGIVHCAETDFLAFPMGAHIPNDPAFTNQWGLNNTGQIYALYSGGSITSAPDADIDAPEAWAYGTGSRDIKVCVLDSGSDFTHEDLQANVWINAGEAGPLSTNGFDDDGNGYIDDYRGWDFVLNNNDPSGEAHGIGIHGVVGATADNGIGMAGVCPEVSMMVLSVSGFAGGGQGSASIDAMNYAVSNGGCRVFNVSWGFKASEGGYNEIFRDAIAAVGEQGALLVAAVGNFGTDIDTDPIYPASYDLSNIIAVAASNWDDDLSGFSCFGATNVDLAAPGSLIYTPAFWLEAGPNEYTWWSGTSFAAPHVVGACAWLWSLEPDLTPLEVKARIMDSVDLLPALTGKCVSGGRLNLAALYSGGDADNDGLPDWWEMQYYGGPTNANPAATAANGINTVRQAYIAGLNPTNPASRFVITDFESDLQNVIYWPGVSGRVYTVYWSSNLLGGFQTLESNVPWTCNSFTDTIHTTEGKGFYKIEVELELR